MGVWSQNGSSYALLASGSYGLTIVDITDMNVPINLDSLAVGWASDVAAKDGLAYVTQSTGLSIVDLGTPTDLQLVSNLAISGLPSSVTLSENHAYIANGSYGLVVADVSTPARPWITASYDSAGTTQSVAVNDGIIWLADDAGGLLAIQAFAKVLILPLLLRNH